MLYSGMRKILQTLYSEQLSKEQDKPEFICWMTEGARYSGSYMLNNRRCKILHKVYAERQKVQDTPEIVRRTTKGARLSTRKNQCSRMWQYEYGITVEQYQEMCVRYFEWFAWESRQESEKAMDYTGNDQYKRGIKEAEESQQLRRKEELQKTKGRTEKSHRGGQKGIYWQHMWRDHGVSKNRASWLNLLKSNDIYIYIYMCVCVSYRSANLQTLHFKYLFNKYK